MPAFPGTEVREHLDRYDLKLLTGDWRQYHANRAIVETSTVDRGMLDDVVIGCEENFKAWLGMIGREYAQGKVSEKEAWPLIRLEHTVRIWDLMRAEILEREGAWDTRDRERPPAEALAELAARVAPEAGHPREKLLETLAFAHARGDLRCRREGDRLAWEWVDYL